MAVGLKPPEVRPPGPEKIGRVRGLVEGVRGFRIERKRQGILEATRKGLAQDGDPHNALETIKKLFISRPASAVLEQRALQARADLDIGKINYQQYQKEVGRIDAKIKIAKERGVKVDEMAQELIEHGKTPEQRTLGIDLKGSWHKQAIKSAETEIAGLEKNKSATDLSDGEKAKIDKDIKTIKADIDKNKTDLNDLQSQRKKIEEESGKDFPDEIESLAEKFNGSPLTSDQKEDPLTVIEYSLAKAALKPEEFQALVGRLEGVGFFSSDPKQLEQQKAELLQEFDPKIPVNKKTVGKFSLIAAGVIGYMLVKRASQEQKQSSQGG